MWNWSSWPIAAIPYSAQKRRSNQCVKEIEQHAFIIRLQPLVI
jgi:hypothetical protein